MRFPHRIGRRFLRVVVDSLIVAAMLLPASFSLGAEGSDPKAEAKPPEFPAESIAYFEKKVLPLLEARCFECHSATAKRLEGSLRLDSRAGALKGGDSGAAIVPGKPDESLLIDAIHYRTFEMPPRSRLPEGEVAILTKWVELGAPWSKGGDKPVIAEEKFPLEQRKREHWAWQPIQRVHPPLAAQPSAWAYNDIDRFILAKLNEKGLTPAPDADRRTLIRRAHFALVGLPPTPVEVDDFVNDPAPTRLAFEKVVDRLLESPHFGEHWARHWLDLVRYAETLGHEFDYPLHHAYQYRDYVVRALNSDVPYDQFVREHIAGDLLLNPRKHPTEGYNESIIGTGFWYLGEDKHAPVDVRGEEAAKVDNQIDVFSKTFLGLTVACARCHDHKFDAISTRDYYALFGFLKSTRRQTALLDPGGKIAAKAAELVALQKEGTAAIVGAAPQPSDATRTDFARHLKAAREVLYGEPKPSDADSADKGRQPDVVFEDFESESWSDKWVAEGAAFANGPVTGTLPNQQVVTGFNGKRLVNSYVGGDNTVGKLTSKPFVIDRRSIRFLIGGGSFTGKTCFNLLVDGKVVRTATGKNNEKLEPAGWDVADLAGELGVLQVVDQQKGGWGHVNVDHIVFSDGESAVNARRPIAAVAKEFHVEAATLKKWVRALGDTAVKEPSHPLATWAALAPSRADAFVAQKKQWSDRLAAEATEADKATSASELFEDFNAGDYKNWFVTGDAFGPRPTGPRDWNPHSAEGATAPAGVAHTGLLSNKLCGVLRSKTFTLKHPQIQYRAAGKGAQIRLIIDGYQMDVFNGLLFGGASFGVNSDNFTWFTQGGDVSRYQGHRCHIELIDDGDGWIAVDEIRFANGSGPPAAAPHPIAQRLAQDAAVTTFDAVADAYAAAWNDALTQWGTESPAAAPASLVSWGLENRLVANTDRATPFAALAKKIAAAADEVPAPMRVVAATDGSGEDERVFIRGSHKNLGGVAPRQMLEAIDGNDQAPITQGSGRLELADRLLDASNPFPSRVMANRVWHHLFGRGLVPSVDNFGVLGEKPSHPELLDWLALSLQSRGSGVGGQMSAKGENPSPPAPPGGIQPGANKAWSTKSLIRQILLSHAWQMSSNLSDSDEEKDPQNLLLHRQNLRRIEGESIRDALLTISGRLDRTVYGPSVPVHLTPHMQGRGRPGGGPLDGNGRRSLYTSINRNFLSPMMLAFDTPIPFTTIGRRNVSNVPAQALILMNDPFVIEQTKLWAKRTMAATPGTNERIGRLYQDAYSRPPTDVERTEAVAFLKAQGAEYGLAENGWETDERPWSDLCHVLVNVKEFIFVN